MILYFATILLALDSAITIVSSQDTSQACRDAQSALFGNRDCYDAVRSVNDRDTDQVSLADAQAYCSSSCRSLIARIIQFCVSCT